MLLTPSETVVLAAGHFAPAPSFTTGKHDPLGGGTAVAESVLAEAVLAAALLGLERDGLVRLTRQPKKELLGLRTTNTVVAERLAGGTVEPPAGTAESGLLAAVGDAPSEVDAVVYRWLGEDHPTPAADVLSRVRDGLVARGLVVRTETRAKKLLWTQTTVSFSVPEATQATLDGAVEPLRTRLAAVDGDLRETLRREIEQGLGRRRDYGDPGDSD